MIASALEKEIYLIMETKLLIPDDQKKEFTQHDFGFEFQGRIDMMDGGLLVEYKRPSKLITERQQEAAKKQLLEYYNQLEEFDISLMIVTDGFKVSEIRETIDGVKSTPFKRLDERVLERIINAIISIDYKKLTPGNIVNDFSLKENGITKKLASKLFEKLLGSDDEESKSDLIYREWLELFHLSESDSGKNQDINKRRNSLSHIFSISIDSIDKDYKGLFALQTTYAIIVKLIAVKMLYRLIDGSEFKYFSDLTSINQSDLVNFMGRMERGELYSEQEISNLLEGDFFSWYVLDDKIDYELYELIIELITIIEDYTIFGSESNSQAGDVFKDLYIEIMPKAVRHSLGEYFTPAWLADSLITSAVNNHEEKDNLIAVDPTCGSGVFLVTLINRILSENDVTTMNDEEKLTLLETILNRVRGVDINPLNVLTARVSYMLAISPTLSDENSFEIPVYLGDSAVTPQTGYKGNILCYEYVVRTLNGSIHATFPAELVDDTKRFAKVINYLSTYTSVLGVDDLVEYLKNQLSTTNSELNKSLEEMISKLIEIDQMGWNGLWVKIIGSFIKTATIKNVDIVVGNPPWVKWEFLPTTYAERIKSLSMERHLFSGQTYMGAISLNICALISHVTATTWLKEDGVLAFLMPKTILTQDSYEGFRNFIVSEEDDERFYLQQCIDWSKAGNPFIDMQEHFLSYIYSKKFQDYSEGVPLITVKKKPRVSITKINTYHSFSEVKDYFELKNGQVVQYDDTRSGFTFLEDGVIEKDFQRIVGYCAYKARSGVEFTPKEVYMLNATGPSANSPEEYSFFNDKSGGTVHKVSQEGEFILETKYIKPLIKGPMVGKYNINHKNEYCIYPYEYGNTISTQMNEILKDSPLLASYLVRQKTIIEAQSERSKAIAKGKDFYSLSKIGSYTYAPYKVVFRDNSKWAAAILAPSETDWGTEVLPIPAKHAPYISQRKPEKGEKITDESELYITKEEAYFICAIINTPIVESYMLNTYSKRSFSINLKIKIPLFDETNDLHMNIVELSKEIEMDAAKLNENLEKINELYLELCDQY